MSKSTKGLGFMGKEGPCCHCGIEYTPLWRNGPRDKPVLCNACGSRWRTRGTLNDYIPKHALKEPQSSQTDELPPTETAVAEPDHSSASIGGTKTNNSSAGSSSTKNCSLVASTYGCNMLNFDNLPRRRRSVLDQIVLTPVERLSKQLFDLAQKGTEEFLKKPVDGGMLIDQPNNMMSTPPETALGAMLLAPPPKQHESAESESSCAEEKKVDSSTSTENN